MIRYHGGPITPLPVAVEAWTGRHAMVSFAHPDQVALAAEVAHGFTLDSGAYSIWQAGGGALNCDAYRAWVEEWERHPGFHWALIPDVIDGDEDQNRQLAESWPLARARSVPVWHLHESLSYLTWLAAGWDRIALGSSGAWATPGTREWWQRINEAMTVLVDHRGRPKVRIHGLRMMSPTIFAHVPFASVDSTNVARNHGLDAAWENTYVAGMSRRVRAMVLAERIESHASATRWAGWAKQESLELLG